ncbi:MAG: phosphoenolpyruvate synthase, partial [Cyclobacteriaceae bacterium]|nr:phosphoenolpyruvate synthase [Cyclobacteriaceae bacterium]
MHTTTDYIKPFKKLGLRDLALVGGKNASLGEMYQNLRSSGINVPDGFATTAQAYREFLNYNQLKTPLREYLLQLDTDKFSNLSQVGSSIRALFLQAEMPPALEEAIGHGYKQLTDQYGAGLTVAARSSATAEDLPEASFAGQQETFLNISLESELIAACRKCFASLFTDRAIKYRQDLGFDHMMVALSVGVQLMVRADTGCSGVIFTLDPESGHEEIIHVAGVWGIGENIVQGTVNPDEFYVFKPSLEQGKYPIIQRKLGSKNKTMQYAPAPEQGLVNVDTPLKKQQQFVLTDDEVVTLAQWAGIIEKHYGRPMDIEWAKDGLSQELFILQARPETVYSQKDPSAQLVAYKLLEKGQELCRGSGLGNRIAKGQVKVLHSPREASKLQQGDILVTTITNPDWDPILRKVGAIITDQGGRTSHAAIVARELGTVAVVGTGNASQVLNDNQQVTVSCAQGSTGMIYDGYLQWEEQTVDIGSLPQPRTKPLLILGDPQQAFRLAAFPAQGVGLMRLEFVINNSVRVHPLALKYFEQVEDAEARTIIEDLCVNHPRKEEYFVQKLAEGIATIAAAFYPREVIVRTSDFKTNEYANLVGGRYFEPHESNPMLGFRGASRYYHPRYREGFAMECQAL